MDVTIVESFQYYWKEEILPALEEKIQTEVEHWKNSTRDEKLSFEEEARQDLIRKARVRAYQDVLTLVDTSVTNSLLEKEM